MRLSAENCEPGQIQREPRDCPAHVSAVASRDERCRNDRGEVMSHFEEPRQILAGSFRNGRLWLIQFFLNPILFGLFAAWLLIPEAKIWQLGLNVLLVVLIAAAALLLHAGTLNYFSDQFPEQPAAVTNSFGRAPRPFAPISVCASVFFPRFAVPRP